MAEKKTILCRVLIEGNKLYYKLLNYPLLYFKLEFIFAGFKLTSLPPCKFCEKKELLFCQQYGLIVWWLKTSNMSADMWPRHAIVTPNITHVLSVISTITSWLKNPSFGEY